VSSIAGALASARPCVHRIKGAVNSMTLHLARSLASGNSRQCGLPRAHRHARWFGDGVGPEAYEAIKLGFEQATPLARACTAEDVAEAVVWPVDGARTVTGELILLDSGMHLVTTRYRRGCESLGPVDATGGHALTSATMTIDGAGAPANLHQVNPHAAVAGFMGVLTPCGMTW
jgi:hypothetical protein